LNSLKDSEAFLRKKEVTTAYERDFGYSRTQSNPVKNILHFKPISELEYSEWMEPLAVQFLDNWRKLNDDTCIYDSILTTLRSLNARYRANLGRATEFQDKYKQKNIDWDLTMPANFMKTSVKEYIY
jgi:hypothetical protein